jgi:peptidoglycan hydrolase-like protein with peptidoglycan-binding domain
MDYMAYSHMFMANEEANENVEYNLPNFQLEWKKLLRPAGIGAATADNLTKSQFHWLNFLKSSAWLALAGISVFFATVTHAQTVSTSYVTTNGSCLRVREDANLHSRILDCIPNRTQLTTTRIINGFAQLSPSGFVSTPETRNAIFRNGYQNGYQSGTGGPVILGLGSRGSAVTEIQRALGVEPTGYYGPTTTRVVREFQARNYLRVDGIVGPETRNAILRN